ncbi:MULTISPECIES: VOC family protein [Sphingomonadales]|uniref:Glyoxalase/bleomycin resistance protein/dioxygenase n=2 Tax=Rhizorhabdus wittichii TaxID=160791 RepID=A0A9J9H959_RHIWR|nr:Glyoxalase/bleomycin resistance protein/dioxygenase [Rhizorhabdus wittichii RW1]ARR55971.1 glyoxalase [Rhizorhabdus wittichii DC-6]
MMTDQQSNMPSPIVALGYLGFYAQDLAAWEEWATQIFGFAKVRAPEGISSDHLYLRIDERQWRFAVEPGTEGRVAFIGWEAADANALEEVHRRLTAQGIEVVRDAELARKRCVQDLIRCEDPDGFRLEFFHGHLVSREPFVSPRGIGFVTGDMGLGHILITVSDIEKSKAFYLDLLGFRMSDYIVFGGNKVHFTHINPRHHSLAFVQTSDRIARLGHFMVEADDVDAVGFALDRLHASTWQLKETLGRHTNDRMLSFYCENPSGSQTEFGWGGRKIAHPGWLVETYDATAFWGHKVPGTEYSDRGPQSPREGI